MRLLEQSSFALQERTRKGLVYSFINQIIKTTYTERFLSSVIALISILRRPMMNARRVVYRWNEARDNPRIRVLEPSDAPNLNPSISNDPSRDQELYPTILLQQSGAVISQARYILDV